MTTIRKLPLFEIYIDNDSLVINNTDSKKDNSKWILKDVLSLELIKKSSLANKIIEVTFGLIYPPESNTLRIRHENGFKDIILTNCDINKVEILIYDINKLLLDREKR